LRPAEEGGFAAYGPRLSELFLEIMPRQVVQLFRGTKVADIPVEQASKFELVINLKTAKAMGVTVPELVAAFEKPESANWRAKARNWRILAKIGL
jgi:ABC-type uncharacterized transport system substrate-binding protein